MTARQRQLVLLVKLQEYRPHITMRMARRWVAEKRLAYYKVDGRIFFTLDEVDSYVEQGRIEAAS